MKDLLFYILEHIVSNPDAIVIEEDHEDGIFRFNLTLDENDYANVIGRRGLTIKAITDIVRLHQSKEYPDDSARVFINVQN